jgi:hypothetical protein
MKKPKENPSAFLVFYFIFYVKISKGIVLNFPGIHLLNFYQLVDKPPSLRGLNVGLATGLRIKSVN